MEIASICRSLKLLDILGNQVTGFVSNSFGDIELLVSLDLSENNLRGPIPLELDQLKDLKHLSMTGNNLTDAIPPSLGQLSSLKVLKLSSNSLSREIPKEIVNLKNLAVLVLNNNTLSGQIPPGLANVTTLSSFNVSFNNFAVFRSAGNHGDSSTYSYTPPGSQSQNNRFNSIEIALITYVSAIVLVLLALIILFLYTRKCKPKSRVGGSERRREVTVFADIGVPLTFENVGVSMPATASEVADLEPLTRLNCLLVF
ncbi:hypothetical protein GIB67_030839 [Kingdonia uniflora]|uniref:Uncharacterized protein n=1 Tax=Kingdonia uniflora TaxID=39325 RepID=A0A7J7L379_9MAGN|nr:hypothetical protein GIB67_030839 [Kingdonia uniflora]